VTEIEKYFYKHLEEKFKYSRDGMLLKEISIDRSVSSISEGRYIYYLTLHLQVATSGRYRTKSVDFKKAVKIAVNTLRHLYRKEFKIDYDPAPWNQHITLELGYPIEQWIGLKNNKELFE